MRKISKFLIELCSAYFVFIFLNAATINEIKIEGNSRVSDETIKVYGDIRLKDNIDNNKINEILNNLYSTDFFEDIKINEVNGVLNIIVKEYPLINQLIINGEPSNRIKEEIKKQIFTKSKRSYVKSYLSNDVNLIKKLYSSIGYNFPNIDVKIKELDGSNVDVLIDIDKGQITKISSISFIGDKKIRDNRLRDVIASQRDRFYKIISKNTRYSENLINLDLRLLKNYYKSLGFYDVEITSNSAELNENKNIDLVYSINAGKRYRINKFLTNVDQTFDKELFLPLNKKYNEYIGEFYSPFKVKDLLEEVDLIIEKNSLQFVEHNVEELIEGDSITIKFNIFEGEKTLVERINITGNNITNESVIRGELIIDEGDPFTILKLEKSIAEIKSRNIFNEVKYEIADGSSDNLKIINISVTEKPTGEISAGADKKIFNRSNIKKYKNEETLKLVTHHWGTNPNKGFSVYQKIDQILDKYNEKPFFTFKFIGNLPKNVNFKNIEVLEPVKHNEIGDILKNHHLYITASLFEPSGNHHVEAMQCGLPVLYINSGGTTEYCKDFGIEYNEANLEEKIRYAKENYGLYFNKLIDHQYDSETMCKNYLELFTECAKNKKLYIKSSSGNIYLSKFYKVILRIRKFIYENFK